MKLVKRQDISGIPAMKDEHGNVLRDDDGLKLIWVEHFKTLMNVENEREETNMINMTEG